MNPRKLKKKLVSYIKFKELAKSIKLVALSQLNNLKKKISSRGIPLSSVIPFFDNSYYNTDYMKCLIVPINVDKSCCGPHNRKVLYTMYIFLFLFLVFFYFFIIFFKK